VRKGR
jgi:Co/Zn/Cd efflux system component